MPWKPRKILIESAVAETETAGAIRRRWPEVPVIDVERVKSFDGELDRRDLAIAKQRGRFIKKCPGTPAYTCCDYYILNLGIGCRLECSYCYLQHYMNTPFTIFANLDDLLAQAQEYFGARDGRRFRVGSGQFIDSLDFDELADVHRQLVPALTSLPNVTFEIKTKTDRLDHLLDLDHHERAVISWSVNPDIVARVEEAPAPRLTKRLSAASRAVAAGYRVGFHFDPIVHFAGWEREYEQVVAAIFAEVPARKVAWISLGALRFNPTLKPIIEDRFPHSRLTTGELIKGLDGKYRYFIAIRRQLFSRLNAAIRDYAPDVPVYLCMEDRALAASTGVSGL